MTCLVILLAGQARPIFPFTAIVGQEEMKLALILNVIDPKIGGVMIMGDRGTGKSTTIRALADLLPEMPVIASECPRFGLDWQNHTWPCCNDVAEHPMLHMQQHMTAALRCVWRWGTLQCRCQLPHLCMCTNGIAVMCVALCQIRWRFQCTIVKACVYTWPWLLGTRLTPWPLPRTADDPYNSHPTDPELMSAEVRERLSAGSDLPVGSMKIPMVDLPLGATEDRVCGTIDIEKALTEGGCCRGCHDTEP